MKVVPLADELEALIATQVSAGRARDEAGFVEAAIRHYAAELDAEDALLRAADEGTADIAAGRYELFASQSDRLSLRQSMIEHLDKLEAERTSAR